MITLKSNKCFPKYQNLTKTYDPHQPLVPPIAHTQHVDGYEAYEQVERELADYLLDNKTI